MRMPGIPSGIPAAPKSNGPEARPLRGRGSLRLHVEPLRGERENGRAAGVDLAGESAIPGHDHSALLVDLVDDAPVAGAQAGVVTRRLDELDPGTD